MSGAGGDPAGNILASNLKQGSAPPTVEGGAATGASVSGGASGGGAPNDPVATPLVEKPGGLKGLFNDLKNTVAKAFFGNGSVKKAAVAPVAGSADVSRFKPNMKLRGGPVQRDLASANEKTIFELINECANGLRCKSVTTSELLTGP